MKKNGMFLALAVCSAVFFGCKSTNIQLNEYSPVVVMSVYGNPTVPWYEPSSSSHNSSEVEEEGVLTGAINKMLNKNNPEYTLVQERIDDAAEIFVSTLRRNGIKVYDPKNARGNPAYKKAGKSFMNTLERTVPASGYAAVTNVSRKMNRTVCEKLNAQSAIYVQFNFQKMKYKQGIHDAGVQARVVMNVYASDKDGKTIINKEYKVVSSNWTEYYNSKWDRDAVCGYFYDTVQTAVNQFVLDYIVAGEPALEEETEIAPDEEAAEPVEEPQTVVIPKAKLRVNPDGTYTMISADGTETTVTIE